MKPEKLQCFIYLFVCTDLNQEESPETKGLGLVSFL